MAKTFKLNDTSGGASARDDVAVEIKTSTVVNRTDVETRSVTVTQLMAEVASLQTRINVLNTQKTALEADLTAVTSEAAKYTQGK